MTEKWRKEHPDVEPASKLLKRILTERRRKWEENNKGKKYNEPKLPDLESLWQLPDSWTWITLDQLSNANRAITYGVIKLGNHIENGVPTLRSSNVRHLWIELDKLKKIRKTLSDSYSRTILEGGEVLVTVRGTLGGVVEIHIDFKGWNISREVAMIAPLSGIVSRCLAISIGSEPVQRWLLRRTRGIAYTGINIETLKTTPIPLMPVEEQEVLVAEVEKELSSILKAETIVDNNIKRAERLRQSILKKAFSGKLVPQEKDNECEGNILEDVQSKKMMEKIP